MTNVDFSVAGIKCTLNIAADLLQNYFILRYVSNPHDLGEIRISIEKEKDYYKISSFPKKIVAVIPAATIIEGVNAVTVALLEYNLVQRGILLLHASGIRLNEGGYLFSGLSGSGKTTITKNASKNEIICDDVAVVDLRKKPLTYCSPFDYGRILNRSDEPVAIKKIFFLKKSKIVKKKSIASERAVFEIMQGDYLASSGLLNSNKQADFLQVLIGDISDYKKIKRKHGQLILKLLRTKLIERLFFPKKLDLTGLAV